MTILYYCYLLILLSAVICGIWRFRSMDTAGKLLCIFTGFTFVAEATAYVTAKLYHDNTLVYTASSILQMALQCLYFNYCIDTFQRTGAGIWIGIISIIFGTLNAVFAQSNFEQNNYFLIYEGMVTVCICLFGFLRLLLTKDIIYLRYYSHFWVMVTLMCYWALTFLSWSIYTFFGERMAKFSFEINFFILAANILGYTAFAAIFLLYPKMKEA